MQDLSKTSLNFDILVAMMCWIRSRKDLISFMSTCSSLYTAGLPALLGLHHRIDATNLLQFYEFMVSRGPASFTALRSLELYAQDRYGPRRIEQDKVNMLDDILARAQGLRNLQVRGSILHDNIILYQKLASLPTLVSLDLSHSYSLHTADLALVLKELQSPLVKFAFQPEGEVDLVALLANCRHTLEHLSVGLATFRHGGTEFCYPKLVYLKLHCVSFVHLSVLVPAFPNLQTLELYDVDDSESFERSDNIRFQQDHPSQRWRLLLLTGDNADLHNLALQTQVPSVAVVGVWWGAISDLSEEIGETLSPLRPVHLSLEGYSRGAVEWTLVSSAIAAGWPGLVRLDLTVEYHIHNIPFHNFADCLDKLVHELHLVSASQPGLLCISVVLDANRLSGSDSSPVVNSLDGLEIDALAVRAIQAIPTLKAAKFVVTTARTRASYWIGEDGGDLVPVLSQDEALACQTFDEYVTPLVEMYIAAAADHTDEAN